MPIDPQQFVVIGLAVTAMLLVFGISRAMTGGEERHVKRRLTSDIADSSSSSDWSATAASKSSLLSWCSGNSGALAKPKSSGR